MQYNLPIDKDHYHKSALKLINVFLNLTDLEIDIIAEMLKLNIKTLDKDTRKQIRESLDIDQFTFNNYIVRLKANNTLKETKFGLAINPNLVNSLTSKEFTFKFELTS